MLHRLVTAPYNHGIVSWFVADNTALAALSLSAADIGRVAVKASSFDILYLRSVGPAVWESLLGGGGGGSSDAEDINIVDAGGYYTGTNVEDALQEVGAALALITAAITDLEDQVVQSIAIALSDETTDLTTGAGKVSFHMPYDFDISEIIVGLNTAQASGSLLTFDVNVNGSSILSTKITIDNTELTSITAATPAVRTSSTLNKGDRITVDIDTVGAAGADGAKIYIVGKVRV